MPNSIATTKKIQIKPMVPGKVNQIESAIVLLESLLANEWSEASSAWRDAKPENRTAGAAPLFGRMVRLAERVG